jgi:hypothetical protein
MATLEEDEEPEEDATVTVALQVVRWEEAEPPGFPLRTLGSRLIPHEDLGSGIAPSKARP